MKKARLPEEQIIGILQEHEAGVKCADLCRKHVRSKGTFYAWKAKLREDRRSAAAPNETWAMDCAHDQLAPGRKIRALTVVDTFSRFSPTIDPLFSYRAENVVETLEEICARVGYPRTIRVDQGSEFVSRDLDLWAYANDVTLDFSARQAHR